MKEKQTYWHHAVGQIDCPSERLLVGDLRLMFYGPSDDPEYPRTTSYMSFGSDVWVPLKPTQVRFGSGICGLVEWNEDI